MKKPVPMDVVPLRIGESSNEEDELLGLLLACHARIRRFCRLALTLGARPELPAPEVKATAAQCLRYFTEALPLHVRDEEDSLWPRLVDRSRALEATLAQIRAQHLSHGPRIDALEKALRGVFEHPNEPARHRALATAASSAEADFEEHLRLEETELFPALETLLPEVRDRIVAELRARRGALH